MVDNQHILTFSQSAIISRATILILKHFMRILKFGYTCFISSTQSVILLCVNWTYIIRLTNLPVHSHLLMKDQVVGIQEILVGLNLQVLAMDPLDCYLC